MTILHKLWVLAVAGMAISGCGDLPPLPVTHASDGGFLDTAGGAGDGGGASSTDGAFDGPAAGDVPLVSSVDATGRVDAVDTGRVDAVDTGRLDTSAVDGASTGHVDATVDAPLPLVCPTGFADCDGKRDNGCETAIDTPAHCGSCTTACGAVANGSAACVNAKCTVKCTAPYQDCDGKYDNGCEIPVGKGNACDRDGLAAFTGSTPPCGTPYCGSAAASNAVTNFGSWYCSFCDHCYIFSNSGSYCLYTSGDNGDFSGERCGSTCCASDSPQVCPKR